MYDYELKNVVIKIKTTGFIDVKNIVPILGFGVYNPDVFSAATVKFMNPKITVNIFSTGVLMVMGARTAHGALYVIHYLKQRLKFNISFIKITNMFCTYSTGREIDVYKFLENYKSHCYYDPGLFPSCVYKPSHSSNTVSVFSTGSLTIYGCKTVDEINNTIEDVLTRLESSGAYKIVEDDS